MALFTFCGLTQFISHLHLTIKGAYLLSSMKMIINIVSFISDIKIKAEIWVTITAFIGVEDV